MNDFINKSIDDTYLKTIKQVVEWLEKYSPEVVVSVLKEEIAKREANNGQ